MAFAVGQRIGDYEVVGQLGAGGLGVVYEVQHLISRRREAMKILLPDQSGAAEMVERFRREVQTLAGLNHGNIAALHTAFYHEDQLAMVMELVHGETLRDRILRGAITLPQVLDIAGQVLQALDYAHRLGVVHRDIKPSNIMITESGLVKLLDFGIARTEQSSDLTKSGFMVGSLNYMSPEQVSGQKATASSDIYSVGVTVYELLTGRLPIAGATSYETMLGIMQQVPVPPHEIAPAVPRTVSAAVMRALEKDPMRRFATAAEFLAALQGASAGHPTARERATGLAPAIAPPPPVTPTLLHPSTGMVRPTLQSGSGMQSLPLEEVTRKLAVYIGPVAKFVVKKLAAQSDDIDSIYREAAKQITSETDRAAFLRSKAH
ncbi:serine/threonine-protein kinase [Acidicapsa acidisoli]|uniref:serine/threonine-protein kinase n=1 Tax=Acidicapsa acidisoli TaxID=1615681 RepID=UPI0021E02439|nr:serine/threonine-protein kinase [Acidicapsa acidisoli]